MSSSAQPVVREHYSDDEIAGLCLAVAFLVASRRSRRIRQQYAASWSERLLVAEFIDEDERSRGCAALGDLELDFYRGLPVTEPSRARRRPANAQFCSTRREFGPLSERPARRATSTRMSRGEGRG